MGREPVEKIIDGEKYRFMLMKPTESLDMMTKLSDIFGPAISKLFASFDKNDMDKTNVDTALLGDAIAVLCSRMNEGRVSSVVKVFTKEIISLGSEGHKGSGQINDTVFEEHFQGRLLHLAKVFISCLEVQYADFFDVFKGKLGFLKNLAAISSIKQTSKGGNGISGGQ